MKLSTLLSVSGTFDLPEARNERQSQRIGHLGLGVGRAGQSSSRLKRLLRICLWLLVALLCLAAVA